jgi:phospholipid/cholesterol/gamma-HCH transport system permease protein
MGDFLFNLRVPKDNISTNKEHILTQMSYIFSMSKMNLDQELTLPAHPDSQWVRGQQDLLVQQLQKQNLTLHCQDLQSIDSVLTGFLIHLKKIAIQNQTHLNLLGVPDSFKDRFLKIKNLEVPEKSKVSAGYIQDLGTSGYAMFKEIHSMLFLLSESLYWSTFGIFKKITLLKGSTGVQMVRLGSSALPIVLMLSFLIGLTLAFQSAVQLEKFGASIYLVSGVGISMVTEIGPMMTAIILAGRSGSSITAEIASMVVQEEVKALKTMAINPIQFLLIPRFRAMSITMPLLTICSVAIGIFAGLLVGLFYAGIPTPLFFSELQKAVTLEMLFQCLTKSIVFSWIIVIVAVYKGMTVRGGADAVGRATTSCVVFSISSIILADAIFSFIFYF